MGWKYALKLLYHFFRPCSLTVFFYLFSFALYSSPTQLFFHFNGQWMPQTKQRQDHTKRRQSVEDQAPYGEHINNKACGAHSHRAPSHLHMPLICISIKRPLWLSLISNPSPQPHQHTPVWLRKGRRAGNVCRLRPHTRTSRRYTNTHKINCFAHAVYKCAMAEETEKSERELVRSGDVSAGRAHLISTPPSLPSLPFSPLLSSLPPLIIRYLVTSGPW